MRQWGPEAANKVLDGLEANPVPRTIAFGLGGEERVPLEEFRQVYERARGMGLRTVVHAGEGTSPDDVWKAIDVLGVDRVAHGIRGVTDRELLATLARRRIPLDLAVTSNYHVFRAAVECRRLGLPFHATGSPTAGYFLPSALLREFAALILHYRRTTIAACVLIVGAGLALTIFG